MATGGGDEENETSIDVAGFMQAFDDDDDDSSGNISMFCRACLHPYKGEEKSGTIVLKCGRCGQTDTILEQEVGSLDPQAWIGNLMMNKFVQVLKEQEDLSKTLIDPYYADDEFQKTCLALSEFTYRINKITQGLLELADLLGFLTEEEQDRINEWHNFEDDGDTIIDFKPIQEIRAILELHNILNARLAELGDTSADNADNESSESQSSDRANSDNETNGAENGAVGRSVCAGFEKCKKLSREKKDGLIFKVNEFLDTLSPTIQSLIDSLVSKHNLPINTMYNVQQRVIAKQREPSAEDTSEDETEDTESNNVEKTTVSEASSGIPKENQNDLTCAENDSKSQDKTIDEEAFCRTDTKSQDKTPDETPVAEPKAEENGAIEIAENTIKSSNDDDEHDTSSQEKASNKVILAECNEDNASEDNVTAPNKVTDGNSEARNQDEGTEATNNSTAENNDDLDLELVVTPELREVIKQKFYLRFGSEADKSNKTNIFNKFAEEDQARAEENDAKNTVNTVFGRPTIPLADFNPEEHIMMSIYSFATEFVRELHDQKDNTFRDRKDRALENVKARCDHVREEMARVEKCVMVELEKAYERKRKKIENQSKQVDKNREKLVEAERLLFFYARTGQADKLRELTDQINKWREDN